jgi:hypothetical protein
MNHLHFLLSWYLYKTTKLLIHFNLLLITNERISMLKLSIYNDNRAHNAQIKQLSKYYDGKVTVFFMCRHEMHNCPNSDNQSEYREMHSAVALGRERNVLSLNIFISLPYSRMETKVKMITHFRFVLVKFYVGTSFL